MSQHWPNKCTGTMARVRGVIFDSMNWGSMLNETGSISTNTGVAPRRHTELTVAKNVKARDDHFVARADAQRVQGKHKGIGARTAAHSELRPTIEGGLLLEGGYFWSENSLTG